ncbi:MAG: hypothetical protein R3B96_11230 [Pirellulaceae bacterium]
MDVANLIWELMVVVDGGSRFSHDLSARFGLSLLAGYLVVERLWARGD